MQISSYLNTMWYLLITEFQIFKRTIVDKIINLFIWIVTMMLVNSYLMPAFGLKHSYSEFIAASLVASAGLFELFPAIAGLVSDFTGNNIISFYLTLPIPSWLVFVRSIIFYAFNSAVMGIFVLPISKILLWNKFSLSELSLGKFLLIFILNNFFFASFVLWTTSRVMSIEKMQNVWMRFVYPLWYLGGFQYSLKVLYNFWPLLAYLTFLNPMMYIMEGTRATILGQEGSLNFWICVIMLFIFIILFSINSILRLKKQLDF